MSTYTFNFRLVENSYGTWGPKLTIEIGPGGSIESLEIFDRDATDEEIHAFIAFMGGLDKLSRLWSRARYEDKITPRKDDCTLAKSQIEQEMIMKTEDL